MFVSVDNCVYRFIWLFMRIYTHFCAYILTPLQAIIKRIVLVYLPPAFFGFILIDKRVFIVSEQLVKWFFSHFLVHVLQQCRRCLLSCYNNLVLVFVANRTFEIEQEEYEINKCLKIIFFSILFFECQMYQCTKNYKKISKNSTITFTCYYMIHI